MESLETAHSLRNLGNTLGVDMKLPGLEFSRPKLVKEARYMHRIVVMALDWI